MLHSPCFFFIIIMGVYNQIIYNSTLEVMNLIIALQTSKMKKHICLCCLLDLYYGNYLLSKWCVELFFSDNIHNYFFVSFTSALWKLGRNIDKQTSIVKNDKYIQFVLIKDINSECLITWLYKFHILYKFYNSHCHWIVYRRF